jgi:ubiquinone/menaquinone biosynthesis C-methylase UbiE
MTTVQRTSGSDDVSEPGAIAIDPDMLGYYARGTENARLFERAESLLERTRTEELLGRLLPAAPALVLDVGGGSGHYAVWLAERGYDVHLVDPVPLHVEQAELRSATSARPLASIRQGDARTLDWPDDSVEAVLLLGPLYHLTTRDDRLSALAEARRVIRPGGVILAAVISRFASALDGLSKHLFDDPVFGQIVERDLAEGQHRDGLPDGTRGRQSYFTTAYLHRPEELIEELAAAGFQHEATLAVEGPAWLLQDLDEQRRDPARRASILAVVRALEAEPSLLGASSHLMGVGRKPAGGTTP